MLSTVAIQHVVDSDVHVAVGTIPHFEQPALVQILETRQGLREIHKGVVIIRHQRNNHGTRANAGSDTIHAAFLAGMASQESTTGIDRSF